MELVRKDVECNFGILKQRFLVFKDPNHQHLLDRIEDSFIMYCTLHSWLHFHEGWGDWQERGMLSEDDVAVEYDALD